MNQFGIRPAPAIALGGPGNSARPGLCVARRAGEFGMGRFTPHSIRGWAILLGLLMTVGLAKVTLAAVVWRSAYAAGRQVVQIHTVENDTQWLQADVVALQAPRHLAQVMANERSPFAARVELPSALVHTQLAQAADE